MQILCFTSLSVLKQQPLPLTIHVHHYRSLKSSCHYGDIGGNAAERALLCLCWAVLEWTGLSGGGPSSGGFFSLLWEFKENVRPFIPCMHLFFFFFKVEIISCTLIPHSKPGSVHSGSASWDGCGLVFPDELHLGLFPDRFLHYAWTSACSTHSDFIGLRVYACFCVTCHLHFWRSDQGLLHATAVIWGWNGHRIRAITQS